MGAGAPWLSAEAHPGDVSSSGPRQAHSKQGDGDCSRREDAGPRDVKHVPVVAEEALELRDGPEGAYLVVGDEEAGAQFDLQQLRGSRLGVSHLLSGCCLQRPP